MDMSDSFFRSLKSSLCLALRKAIFPTKIVSIAFACYCGLGLQLVIAAGDFSLAPHLLDSAEERFGKDARQRLLAWQRLVQEDTSRNDEEKLKKVNDFFNSVDYVSDELHWRKKDYWATPVEFLASDGGDCEDFSLAKYFTLKLLGVAESKLKMTYVKAWKLNQAHMVVTYYPTPEAEPLVLDNLVPAIQPASKRSDLLPVYSFNGSGLWLAKQRGRGQMVGSSDRLGLWTDFLARMPENLK